MKKLTLEEFINRSNCIYNNKYNYSLSIYKTSKHKLKIICPIHGIFEQTPSNHYRYGCIYCSGKFLRTIDEFIYRANIIHNDKYDYSQSEYKGMFKKLKIICQDHGEFWQLPTNHIHNIRGCPKCSKRISKNEIIWLDSIGLPNDKIHRNVYINIESKKYFVDGLDPINKIVYEFNGDYWHGNLNIYKKDDIHPEAKVSFGFLWERTEKKKKVLEKIGFKVISIWESDFEQNNNTK